MKKVITIPVAEYVVLNIDPLINWDKNPREILPSDFENLKKFILRYGLIDPLVVDARDGITVLGGNMRLKALKELGVKVTMCVLTRPKDDAEALEIALLDNAQFGTYLKDKLKALVQQYDIDNTLKLDLQPLSLNELFNITLDLNDEGLEDKEPKKEDNKLEEQLKSKVMQLLYSEEDYNLLSTYFDFFKKKYKLTETSSIIFKLFQDEYSNSQEKTD